MQKLDHTSNLILIKRIVDAFDFDSEGPGTDNLIWRTDFDFAHVVVMINCNDLFAWGCADGEFILEDGIDLLEDTFDELKEMRKKYPIFVNDKWNEDNFNKSQSIIKYADLLWCARYRKMRPQLAYYKSFPDELKPLFDACGDEEYQYGHPKFYERINKEKESKSIDE